jgi:glycosyltransferase involved in cell wall biosynthesis
VKGYAAQMDMRVKIFHHEWQGLGYSRNIVVNNAFGKYVVWVDGDMILPKDHVRKQVGFMEMNPEVGIGKARYGIYDYNNLVSLLEDVAYLAVDHKYKGKINASRALGTGGSIYRVEAIKDIGGFDDKISGAGEDTDVECKMENAGWCLYRSTPAVFYERRKKTWIDLWKEYFWQGCGAHKILAKNPRVFNLFKMTPLAGFIAGAWYSVIAYKIVRRKLIFLLPLQYTFKRIAWCCGFIKGQIDD